MAAPIIGAGIGAVTSLATGNDPLKGALLGGVGGGLFGGSGGIGSGFTEGFGSGGLSSLFDVGSGAVTNAGSAGTAFGASQAPGALASAGTSAASTGGTTSILGSKTGNIIPSYDMGMQGVNANIGGFTASADPSKVLANNIQPIRDSSGQIIGPDMSRTQQFIDTTPDMTNAKFGSVDPNTLDYTKGQAVQDSFGYSDGIANKSNLEIGPNFDVSKVTKSTADEIAAAQGGYEKSLASKAFDSVMNFAKKNPLMVGSTVVAATGGIKPKTPQVPVTSSGGTISRVTPPPSPGQVLQVRRPTRYA